MKRFNTWKSVVLWSIISAAFIGPGTVTTAVLAGSAFQLDLLWAVVLATIFCVILQELAARITIASGMQIGQILTTKFGVSGGRLLQWTIGGTVISGCAAYEAGNIMGAVSGLNLVFGIPIPWITIGVALIGGILLWRGNPKWISNLMMVLIVVMGIAFFRIALMQDYSAKQVLQSAVTPIIPGGGELLLLGLLGTTIVPYNLFLASGLSKDQTIPMMRIGLAISILIGGIITGAILIAGTSIREFSSFNVLFNEVTRHAGYGAALAMAGGLFAAGFSSTVTAPFASSVIASSVFGIQDEVTLRVVRIIVLMTGFTVGIMGLRPIQVILVVQALNGFILPLLVIFLVLLINDPSLIARPYRHSPYYNVLLLVVLAVVLIISLGNVDKAISSGLALPASSHLQVLYGLTAVIVAVVLAMVIRIRRRG